ncbi:MULTISPECIES: helix-turn-helix domain-containing protein [unclassified Devosia]|uniref:IclR family transcriptional regulator n=1 Tax=unclassified Devosia TaxID=196773 RepID=UPI001555BFE9|nr:MULTISPECIES: helix-turn-helix domain-containing protein [unclassified Devosia]
MTKSAAALADEREDRYRAPALDKGLDILELLSEQAGGLTRGEIVKAMGRSPGEIYRMLERLVVRDYVSRSAEGDRYALTMKLFVLAHRHPPVRRLVARAMPLMDGFAREIGQSCHLVAPDADSGIVVAQASCPGNWEFGIRVGTHLDLLSTGSGLLLLAFQDPHTREELLVRWGGTDKPARLLDSEKVLAAYKAQGFRVGQSQQLVGVEDISVPVLSPDGFAIAALTCPFLQRLDGTAPNASAALASLKALGEKLSLS